MGMYFVIHVYVMLYMYVKCVYLCNMYNNIVVRHKILFSKYQQ